MNYIFDLYGTLIDVWTDEQRPQLWEGVSVFLGESPTASERIRAEYLSLCSAEQLELSMSGRDELCEIDLLRVFSQMLSRRSLPIENAPLLASEFRRLSRIRLRTFPGVKRMLSSLRKLGSVYLVSNAQSCFTMDELRSTRLIDLFDGILISSDVGIKKPSPEIFSRAFSRFGITPSDSVYIGNDLRDDILGAHRAGMRSVYIETPQSGSYPSLDLPDPTFVAKTHSELSQILHSIK